VLFRSQLIVCRIDCCQLFVGLEEFGGEKKEEKKLLSLKNSYDLLFMVWVKDSEIIKSEKKSLTKPN